MKFNISAKFDVIIVGSGISGLICALELAKSGKTVFIATKEAVTESSSLYAQGGIAVPLSQEDSVDKHLDDTIKVGCRLNDTYVARKIISYSNTALKKLINYGVKFDLNLEGHIHQTKEAAHLVPRVVHVGGDTTGRFVVKALIDHACREPNISISQGTTVLSILKNEDRSMSGVLLEDVARNKYVVIANDIIVASGGIGQLFARTTNPLVCTGDGIILAHKIGAELMDLEMIQFHPTVCLENGDPFLITEAVRGEGGRLKNINNKFFASQYHELAELAPRDILARAILKEMNNTKSKYVLLDISNFEVNYFQERFPTVFKVCVERKFDLFNRGIPVAPAAHYFIGGIKTNIYCQTTLPHLWALGECAVNGFHGANRLASNSLLECIVTPYFLVEELLAVENKNISLTNNIDKEIEIKTDETEYEDVDIKNTLLELKKQNSKNLGLLRSEPTLQEHNIWLNNLITKFDAHSLSVNSYVQELKNMLLLSYLISVAAIERKSSLGVHYREDGKGEVQLKHSLIDKSGHLNWLLNPITQSNRSKAEKVTF